MKIFVTGASGFLGSFLCEDLVKAGHDTHVMVRNPLKAWRLEHLKENLTFHALDFTNQDDLAALFQKEKFNAIAHLGWSGVANFDRNNPGQADNISWSARLVSGAADSGTKTFFSLGSQAEFGPQSGVLTPESETNPTTLYGNAKLSTYHICRHIAEENDMRFIWMRVFSTFGERDHPYWMIPSLIEKLLKGENPPLTEGAQHWDFLYGRDAARAMRLALEKETAFGLYCLGSGNAPPLKNTIEKIRDLIDPSAKLGFGEIAYRPDQVMHLQADTSKLKNDLGWQPEYSMEEALRNTIDWYRDNRWVFKEAA
jgi:nucleoside-diphosphate-sugar epimerase